MEGANAVLPGRRRRPRRGDGRQRQGARVRHGRVARDGPRQGRQAAVLQGGRAEGRHRVRKAEDRSGSIPPAAAATGATGRNGPASAPPPAGSPERLPKRFTRSEPRARAEADWTRGVHGGAGRPRHARRWNALVGAGDDRFGAVARLSLWSARSRSSSSLLSAARGRGLGLLIGSVVLHVGYKLFLIQAYRTARWVRSTDRPGLAPLAVALFGAVWLGERLAPASWRRGGDRSRRDADRARGWARPPAHGAAALA